MACNITIKGVFGLGQPLIRIRVVVQAEDCGADVEGNVVRVGISCRSADGPFEETFAQMSVDGTWQAFFPLPIEGCDCGETVYVRAWCVTAPDCNATASGELKCVECPNTSITADDDVSFLEVEVDCDVDGTALVTTSFDVTNTTADPVNVHVNCGPGGTKVSGGSLGTLSGSPPVTVVSVCRYDPIATPNPQPFIEFFTFFPFEPQGCPPIPIPVGTLEPCPEGCPSTVELEVRDSENVPVDIDGVPCLIPGDYKVRVVAPSGPGLDFSWSINNVAVPGPSTNELDVVVEVGQTLVVSVGITVPTCPVLVGSIELLGCVEECPDAVELEVVDSTSSVIDIEGVQCLDPGIYTVRVVTPGGPGLSFIWSVGGVVQVETSNEIDVDVGAGAALEVAVSVSAPGCFPIDGTVSLEGCPEGCPVIEDIDIDLGPCEGGSRVANFTAVVSGPAANSFEWDWGDMTPQETSGGPVSPAHTYGIGDSFTLAVRSTGPGDCEDEFETDFSIPDCTSSCCPEWLIPLTIAAAVGFYVFALALQFCFQVPVPTWILVAPAVIVIVVILVCFLVCAFSDCECPKFNTCFWLLTTWFSSIVGFFGALFIGPSAWCIVGSPGSLLCPIGCCTVTPWWWWLLIAAFLALGVWAFNRWRNDCNPSTCQVYQYLTLALSTVVGTLFVYLGAIPVINLGLCAWTIVQLIAGVLAAAALIRSVQECN